MQFSFEFITTLIGFLAVIITARQSASDIKKELKEDIRELKAEFKSDISELKAEFKSDISELKAEFKSDISELRTELKSDLNTQEVKLNTLILGLFRNYNYPDQPQKHDQQ